MIAFLARRTDEFARFADGAERMLAASAVQEKTFRGYVYMLSGIVSELLVPIVLGATTVVFLYGVAQYMLKGDSAADRVKGRKYMMYGLIGLAVGLSVWSIVALFLEIIGVPAVIPQLG